MGNFGFQELLLFSVLFIFFYFVRKGKTSKDENPKTNNTNKLINKIPDIDIPETCPHCKNPNTKKMRECEWCGSQII